MARGGWLSSRNSNSVSNACPACNRPASRSAAPCAAVGAAFTRPRKVPAPRRVSRGREGVFEPVSLRYFETLGIPFLKGRAFPPADKEGAPPVAIVNQVLARKLFPNGDAVGHRIRRSGARDWETIAGVVGEVHLQSQTEKVHPQVF